MSKGIERKDSIVYFDYKKERFMSRYSFYLDIMNRRVVYSKEHTEFLNKVKACIIGLRNDDNYDNIIKLYPCDSNVYFTKVICSKLLNLELCSNTNSTLLFKVPKSLSMGTFNKVYDFLWVNNAIALWGISF